MRKIQKPLNIERSRRKVLPAESSAKYLTMSMSRSGTVLRTQVWSSAIQRRMHGRATVRRRLLGRACDRRSASSATSTADRRRSFAIVSCNRRWAKVN